MPAPVSKKQYRYMMAILHGKGDKTSSRGDRVPKSVAGKYAGHGKASDLPESKGKEMEGGKWGESHHERAHKKVKADRLERKKKKAKLKKALENYLISREMKGAGCIVTDCDGRILLGKRTDNGMWATPGGHVEPDEDFSEAALRELREETGLVGRNATEIHSGRYRGYNSKTFLVESYKGKLKDNGEMAALKFFEPQELPWGEMTDYSRDALVNTIKHKLKKSKSLKYLMAQEALEKSLTHPNPGDASIEVPHGEALRLVGNGTFRMLRDAVKDMKDEELRDIAIDNYTLHLRKHVSDTYSGRVTDGHKQVHQFANKTLPAVAVELMSIFEWYLPEDEGELELLDDAELDNSIIEGGMNELVDKYRKHNIVNIYSEMENIRSEMRHEVAVDIQQV